MDRTSVFRRGGAQLGPGDGGGRRRGTACCAPGCSRAVARGRRGPFRRSRPWSTRPTGARRAIAGALPTVAPWVEEMYTSDPVRIALAEFEERRAARRRAAAAARPTRKAGAKVDPPDVDWHGYSVAAPTAFDADLAIDERAFRAVLRLYLSQGVHGLLINGTTGEWFAQSPRERRQVAEIAVQEVAGQVPVVIGCTSFTPA